MTIDEILANNEKYEKEKSEFLSSVKKKLECNVSENKLLTNIVNMSGDEFNNYFYKIKENELNKEILEARINKDDHNAFSNFIITLLAMLISFIAGMFSENISNIIETKINVKLDGVVVIVIILLNIIAIVSILVYRYWFFDKTLSYSHNIKNKYITLEDLKLNK